MTRQFLKNNGQMPTCPRLPKSDESSITTPAYQWMIVKDLFSFFWFDLVTSNVFDVIVVPVKVLN